MVSKSALFISFNMISYDSLSDAAAAEPSIMPQSAQMELYELKLMLKHGSNWKRYLERRFPRAGYRRTRRHSQKCRHSQKYSPETSTWLADEPAGGEALLVRSLWTMFSCFDSFDQQYIERRSFWVYEMKLRMTFHKTKAEWTEVFTFSACWSSANAGY